MTTTETNATNLHPVDETWWTVTKLVSTASEITATLSRVGFFIPNDDPDEPGDDAAADDPRAAMYEVGTTIVLPLSEASDMLGIGEVLKVTVERVYRR